jgi:putative molybdopterin biosynthesis protein
VSDRTEFLTLADPGEVRETVAGFDLGGGTTSVPLAEAQGRVLAERVDSELAVPGFDRASMDGYAVRATDTVGASEAAPTVLDVVGEAHAGEKPAVEVDPMTAVEVSTGAVMPPGADAVVMVERTSRRDSDVAIRTTVTPGEHVMPAGDDVAPGERALGPGTVVTNREIGLLAALGRETVPVRDRPRVAVISTGDELVPVGADLRPERGEIYDVNGRSIAAAVRDAGGEPVVYPTVGDDTDEMKRILAEAAADCDLVLTSGATSAGAVDVLSSVIEESGEQLHHGVALKPGKPTLVARLDGTPFVGLPGYPVSALSVFRTLVAPAIRDAAGRPSLERPERRARLSQVVHYGEGRHRLLPVGLVTDGAGETLAYPVDKGSGATTTLTNADGVVEMDAETARLPEGESVTVALFGTAVRPPRLFGVGEADPVLWDLLDAVARTRYLAVGSAEGDRRLAGGVPDIAVVTGEGEDAAGTRLGGWAREWGLVVDPAAAAEIDGLAALVEEDHRFVNAARAGLGDAFDAAVGDLAAERDGTRAELRDAIDGADRTVPGHEGPARKVADGTADAGIGLRSTAEKLGLGFVSLGEQPVAVRANPDRVDKPGVRELEAALSDASTILDGEYGVSWNE